MRPREGRGFAQDHRGVAQALTLGLALGLWCLLLTFSSCRCPPPPAECRSQLRWWRGWARLHGPVGFLLVQEAVWVQPHLALGSAGPEVWLVRRHS